MDLLADSWRNAWAACGLTAPAGVFDEVLSAYSAPQRHYHDQRHLAECLSRFARCRRLAERPGEVELALWFHDAVYDVRAQDNEARSAAWAGRVLAQAGASAEVAGRCTALILATRHAAPAESDDERLLVDIDLAILGAPPARFAEYECDVRAEYAWVVEQVYRAERRKILQQFLARPSIYATQLFQREREAQARENLRNAIAALA